MKKLLPSLFILAILLMGLNTSAQKKSPSLNHIAIYVVDLKKSVRFYMDIMQLDTIPEPFHDGKHAWFRVGPGSSLHVIEGATQVTPKEKSNHICFSVESVEEFTLRLQKNKIAYENLRGEANVITARVDGVKQIYLKDPDGYWLEINDDKSK